jgi:hypothetical protein
MICEKDTHKGTPKRETVHNYKILVYACDVIKTNVRCAFKKGMEWYMRLLFDSI